MRATLVYTVLCGVLLFGVCTAALSKKAHKLKQSRQGLPCESGDFLCNDGSCIFGSWECDGWDDCFGGEDEANCASSSSGCGSYEFTCYDGSCIPSYWQCDNWDDCSGGEDELDCTACDGFTCNDGECIPSYWECDGWDDCLGAEDEANCACGEYDFTCNNGECIPDYWECDGWDDCDGAEDEANCPNSGSSCVLENPCPPGQFSCLYTEECIGFGDLCDGEMDCNSGEDESQFICSVFGDNSKRAPKKRWEKMARKVEQKKRALRKRK